MTLPGPRGLPVALSALSGLSLVLGSCAPERDVVATEVAMTAGGSGGAGGGAGAAGAGGSSGEQTTPKGPCEKLLEDPAAALSLFDFEGADGMSQVPDAAAARKLDVVGTPAAVVLGPEGCGSALSFGSGERHLLLADDPAWTLTQGSIDAWFWVPASVPETLGLISRDQYGDQIGHFSVFLLKDRTVLARLQQSDTTAPAPVLFMGCSAAALPPSSWAHFGFNFGPAGAELFVNGALAMRTGMPGLALGAVACGASAPSPTIPDLPLPWVVGASIYASMDPPNVREFPFLGGAIDNLRISAVQRDFAAAF